MVFVALSRECRFCSSSLGVQVLVMSSLAVLADRGTEATQINQSRCCSIPCLDELESLLELDQLVSFLFRPVNPPDA